LALTDILVVNTVPAMQKEAADALAQGKLLYWSDDTHWNANGVRVAAIEVRKLLAASGKNSAALKLRRVSVVHSQ
jgi:predicted RecA/RadA family phage recombinase